MDDTSESPEDAQPDPKETDASDQPSDPSALLASAAAALEKIDDPEFEGHGGSGSDGSKVDAGKGESANHPTSSSGDYSRAVLSIETPVAVVLAKQKSLSTKSSD